MDDLADEVNDTDWHMVVGKALKRPRTEYTDRATIERHRAMEDHILHRHSSSWWAMVRASPRVKALHTRRHNAQKNANAAGDLPN